ncbi:MAG: hypothetical protein IH600_18240 [Bacteroidetes bacterium]|nr:hypothetical protein [Bacteroidota bacterium]
MKQYLSAILAAFLLAITLPACSTDGTGTEPEQASTIEATSLSVSRSEALTAANAVIPFASETSSFQYRYDTGSGDLHVRHANAAFKPGGDISVGVRIEENIITVIERQHSAASGSLGLYDLDFVITNLPVRAYRVVVIEPYLQKDQDPLSFRMDLVENLAGSSTEARTQSPWGEVAAF